IRAALLRDGVLQIGLRLADARELLRKVEAALQGERDEHALLLERIVSERGRGGVGAGGVAVGAAADEREVGPELGALDVERGPAAPDLGRGGACLGSLLQRAPEHLVLVGLWRRIG